MDERIAYVGIGSNQDDPERQVRGAITALAQLPRSRFVRSSRLFLTRPWGKADQPDFVNAAISLMTRLSPHELLDALLAIERKSGRRRDGEHWGPRVLDLDILLYGDLRIDDAGLRIPHARLAERAFALLPLADIERNLIVPGQGALAALIEKVDASGCTPIDDPGALEHYGADTK